jgi:hypothetical protein
LSRQSRNILFQSSDAPAQVLHVFAAAALVEISWICAGGLRASQRSKYSPLCFVRVIRANCGGTAECEVQRHMVKSAAK